MSFFSRSHWCMQYDRLSQQHLSFLFLTPRMIQAADVDGRTTSSLRRLRDAGSACYAWSSDRRSRAFPVAVARALNPLYHLPPELLRHSLRLRINRCSSVAFSVILSWRLIHFCNHRVWCHRNSDNGGSVTVFPSLILLLLLIIIINKNWSPPNWTSATPANFVYNFSFNSLDFYYRG